MIIKTKRVLTVFLSIAVLLSCACPAVLAKAAEPEPETVFSAEELVDWLDENEAGDTVCLGADIAITECVLLNNTNSFDFITIDAGGFQFRVSDILSISEGIRIIGDGVRSVIDVVSGGKLYIGQTTYDAMPTVTATANGGCALYFHEGSEYVFPSGSMLGVSATGENAAGIRSEIPLSMEFAFIEASGNGSVGIDCAEEVSLLFCAVTAGGASVTAPAVTNDTCILSPAADNTVKQIKRKLTDCTAGGVYAFPTGDETPLILDGRSLRTFLSFGATGEDDVDITLMVKYNAVSPIDIETPGAYILEGTLPEPYSRFDLIGDVPVELAIEIYDSRIPKFLDAWIVSDTDDPDETGIPSMEKSRVQIEYAYQPDDARSLVLWVKCDGKEEWQDFTDMVAWEQSGNILTVTINDTSLLSEPLSLVIEVLEKEAPYEKIGETSILRLTYDGIRLSTDWGGDRTGGDRDPGADSISLGNGDSGGNTGENPNEERSQNGDNADGERSGNTGNSDTQTPSGQSASDESGEKANQSQSEQPETDNSETPAVNNRQGQKEYSNETTLAISGKRLSGYLKTNGQYTFICGQLRLSLTKKTIDDFSLTDDDILMVKLMQSGNDRVTVAVYKNGVSLTGDFTEAAVFAVPWAGGVPKCVDENEETLSCAYDQSAKTVKVSLSRPGQFTFVSGSIQANEDENGAIPAVNLPEIPTPVSQTVNGNPWSVVFITVISLFGTGMLLFAGMKRQKGKRYESV